MKTIFSIAAIGMLTSFSAGAWTLVDANRSHFSNPETNVFVATNDCVNAGFTSSSMQTLVTDAINQYWAKVPTSSLDLTMSGAKSADLSADTLTTAAGKSDANSIIVGCSSNATTFTSGTTLAVGGIACNNGVCHAGVLLNDTAATKLATLDRQTILATFAHELGHALGLGHSSQEYALMYYNAGGKTQKSLSQDDIDGISYLYPSKKSLGGLGGACGTVADISNDKGGHGGNGQFFMTIALGLGLVALGKKLFVRN